MAVLKRDTTFNELFIKPICGLYDDQAFTVEEFKDRHEDIVRSWWVDIVRSRWVDTTHGKNGLKILVCLILPLTAKLSKKIYKNGFVTTASR